MQAGGAAASRPVGDRGQVPPGHVPRLSAARAQRGCGTALERKNESDLGGNLRVLPLKCGKAALCLMQEDIFLMQRPNGTK